MVTIDNIFAGQVELKDLTKYTLGRGVADYTNLIQYDMYEKGYPFLIVLRIPEMLKKLRGLNDAYAKLIDNYVHVLEYDFQSLDGLENMGTDTTEISNGVSTLDIITKVNWQSNGKFSMKYQERKGSLFARMHELYLRGIKDPKTQVKRYNGLLKTDGPSVIDPGYENEVFEFLYFVTDNTARNIEKAFLLTSCQLTECTYDQYNQARGSVEWQDVSLGFNGYAITNPLVTAKAQEFMDWLNNVNTTVFEETKFAYKTLVDMPTVDNLPGPQVSMREIKY